MLHFNNMRHNVSTKFMELTFLLYYFIFKGLRWLIVIQSGTRIDVSNCGFDARNIYVNFRTWPISRAAISVSPTIPIDYHYVPINLFLRKMNSYSSILPRGKPLPTVKKQKHPFQTTPSITPITSTKTLNP